jgi:Deuterolysin metalloprotease (M35) family
MHEGTRTEDINYMYEPSVHLSERNAWKNADTWAFYANGIYNMCRDDM